LLSLIISCTKPVSFENTAAMISITTHTTLSFHWEDYVSFFISD
jgi:hypothetical protein